jgi:Nif-specific regulatory protein
MEIPKLTPIARDQFETFYQISALLNRADYEEALVAQALDLVIDAVQAERGLFARCEAGGESFAIVAARTIRGEDITDLSEFSANILREVVRRREPSLFHDVQQDPGLSQFSSVQIQQITSVIGVPIFNGEEIWGVILADSREQRALFTPDNLRALGFFANMVSLALRRIIQLQRLQEENRLLKSHARTIPDLIGESKPMQQLAALVHRVAQSDATVLLLGESGTGKDLVAHAIHRLSSRAGKPYLAQFCGSIPDTLLESELFGYKKGAFTGAVSDKKGLFEVAHDGTFFLDEIADISLPLQAKLLRVLQNQEIIRLGDTRPQKINVRIIAATNRDLHELTTDGRFRQDLYYRLNVFPITLPPLRERRADIPLLTNHFIAKYSPEPVPIQQAAMKKLLACPWPGNVRQLENVIQRALILRTGGEITLDQIILDEEEDESGSGGTLEEHVRALLARRLQEQAGNRTATAQSLGVSVRWVQMKLREMSGYHG